MIDLGEARGLTSEEMTQDYDFNQRRSAFVEMMTDAGYQIVLPEDDELQIDIDSEEQYAVFQKSLACLLRNWTALAVGAAKPMIEERASKSGLPRRHVTVYLPFDLDPWQRIAFQAALGSDPMRELLSAVRLYRGDEHPTLFVEKP